MDIRRLGFFVTIVDTGSITRAADILNIAQPALSQHVAALEHHFRKKLLIRGQRGVSMTEAGRVLYRHARTVLRQLDQARAEIRAAGEGLTGRVSVGLVPFSGASALSLELLSRARERHPGILLQLTESVSQPYSQMIANGRLEMALLHGTGPLKGLRFERIGREDFVLVLRADLAAGLEGPSVPAARLGGLPFLLPPAYNLVRRAVEQAFARARVELSVIAEIDAVRTLSRAVQAGLGATIVPPAIAERIVQEGHNIRTFAIGAPVIGEVLSLCTSELVPLSEPAEAIRELLRELARSRFAGEPDPEATTAASTFSQPFSS